MSMGSNRKKYFAIVTTFGAMLGVLAVSAAPALASGKPLVETKAATEVRGTEATLNAVVNPNDAETKYYFEYGLKTEKTKYEHKTAEVSTPASETNIPGSKAVSELTAKTEYRFRMVATNVNGTTYGEEASFTTTALVVPEFRLAAGEKFPDALAGSSSSSKTEFESTGGTYLLPCYAYKSKGEITGAKALSLTLELEDCGFEGKKCATPGAEEGTEVLPGSGSLVYIAKATEQVGVLFTLKEAISITCEEITSKIKGSIVVPITPINTKTGKVELKIRGSKGKQEITKYENAAGEAESAKFEINSGTGYLEGDISMGGELELTASKPLTVSLLPPPPPPPVVTTGSTTKVTEAEATLHGTVNPEGTEAKYHFEYGAEKGKFTTKTAEVSAGSGTEAVEVSKAITGLAASTTYYYRIVATNTGGTSDGVELSFATSAKPTGETKPATGIVETEATLPGVTNPRGAETTYYFEYGLATEKTKYEHATAKASAGAGTTNVEVSKNATALTAKTTYRFRIVATNVNGTSDGAEQTFTTAATGAPPEFILGEGEAFPVALEGSFLSTKSSLKSVGGESLSCDGIKVTGSITEAKALSTTVELEKCEEPQEKAKCSTEGAEVGLVVLSGSGSLVYVNKAKKEFGVLFTLKESKITCGEEKVKLRGTTVATIAPSDTKTTKVDLAFKGNGAGKQTVEYETEKGEIEKARSELNFGTGYEEGAVEMAEELDLTANKSLTVSG